MKGFAAGLCLVLLSLTAQAHERSESVSHWEYAQGELSGVISIRSREITRLLLPGEDTASLDEIFAAHVARAVSASVDGRPCRAGPPQVLRAEPGYTRIAVTAQCVAGSRLTIEASILLGVAPSHHHFIYVEAVQGARVVAAREAILTLASTSLAVDLAGAAPSPAGIWEFVAMGIMHIATGVDHLAFLLALLIGVRSVRQALWIITGFTLGHSLTLSLAVLGIIEADRTAVEALIGLTIALTAALNLLRSEREGQLAGLVAAALVCALLCVPAQSRPDLPWPLLATLASTAAAALWLGGLPAARDAVGVSRVGLAAGFGLVHGLGFASALQDLHLPRERLVTTLLGFNAGVEIGQLVAVGLGLVLVRLVARQITLTNSRVWVSALLLALGISWFLTRALQAA